MAEHSQSIKRLLQQWKAEAHERELHRELTRLDESFAEWRKGLIGSGELSHRLHEWESGPARSLFKQYNDSRPDMMVAYAIVLGILDEREVPVDLLEALSGPLAFYRSLQAEGNLRDREGAWWRE
jgi:hypothetical protein